MNTQGFGWKFFYALYINFHPFIQRKGVGGSPSFNDQRNSVTKLTASVLMLDQNIQKVKKNPDLNSVMQNKCQSSIADFSISRKLSDFFRFTKKVLALKILLCFVLSNKNQRYLKTKQTKNVF